MKLVKEYINEFKRGLDPKVAMDIGIFSDIKAKMNGVIATHDIAWDIEYISMATYQLQIDEETGIIGWPYIGIRFEPKLTRSARTIPNNINNNLKYIFKKLGISGKLLVTGEHALFYLNEDI